MARSVLVLLCLAVLAAVVLAAYPGHLTLSTSSQLTYGCVPPCKCATRIGDLVGQFDARMLPSRGMEITNVQFASVAASMKWTGAGTAAPSATGNSVFWNFQLTDNNGNSWNYNGTAKALLPVNVTVSGQRSCRDESFTLYARAPSKPTPSSS